MGDPFRKMVPGQRLSGVSARTWNRLMDAANRVSFADPSAPPPPVALDPATVWASNATGAATGRFAVLTVQDSILDPSSDTDGATQDVMVEGITPTAAGQAFVVVIGGLQADEIGRAVAAGVVWVRVEVSSSGHAYATTINGNNTKLASSATADGCARIVWKESGTGTKWALIALPVLVNASSGGGITSLGGQTGATQTFSTGASGSDANWLSSGNVHTYNLPDAGSSARGAVTTGTQTFAGAKTFTAAVNAGGLHITNVSGSNTNITIDLPGSGSAVGSITIGATTDGLNSGVGMIYCDEANVNDITGFITFDTGDDSTLNGLLTGRYYNEGGSIYGYKDSRFAVTVLDTGIKYGATGTLVDGSEVYGGIVCTIGTSLAYTAATAADWAASTPPTNVAAALDRLAAACTAAGFPP